jgi:stage III sporulation protein AG
VWSLGKINLRVNSKMLILALVGVTLILIGNRMERRPVQMKSNDSLGESNVLSISESEDEASSPSSAAGYSLAYYEDLLSKDLELILSQVEGAGKVLVKVSLKSGPEKELARDRTQSARKTDERDERGGARSVIENTEDVRVVMRSSLGSQASGSLPMAVREVRPEIAGVVVVAEGASDSSVKNLLGQAVRTLLDIPVHKVIVLPRKGGRD